MQYKAIIFVFSILFASGVLADAEAGKEKAAMCMACHGLEGISNTDMWPNLAGQKRGYLIAQIKAYKSGVRKDPMMLPMVKALSEDDIKNIADYYSSLRPEY